MLVCSISHRCELRAKPCVMFQFRGVCAPDRSTVNANAMALLATSNTTQAIPVIIAKQQSLLPTNKTNVCFFFVISQQRNSCCSSLSLSQSRKHQHSFCQLSSFHFPCASCAVLALRLPCTSEDWLAECSKRGVVAGIPKRGAAGYKAGVTAACWLRPCTVPSLD